MIINLDLKEQENILIQTNHDTVFASKLIEKKTISKTDGTCRAQGVYIEGIR